MKQSWTVEEYFGKPVQTVAPVQAQAPADAGTHPKTEWTVEEYFGKPVQTVAPVQAQAPADAGTHHKTEWTPEEYFGTAPAEQSQEQPAEQWWPIEKITDAGAAVADAYEGAQEFVRGKLGVEKLPEWLDNPSMARGAEQSMRQPVPEDHWALAEGARQVLAGLANTPATLSPLLTGWFVDPKTTELYKQGLKTQEAISARQAQDAQMGDGWLHDRLTGVVRSTGQMLPYIFAPGGTFAKTAGMIGQGMAGEAADARQRAMELGLPEEEVRRYMVSNALAEGLPPAVFSAVGLGGAEKFAAGIPKQLMEMLGKGGDDALVAARAIFANRVKSAFKEAAKVLGRGAAEELPEENLTSIWQTLEGAAVDPQNAPQNAQDWLKILADTSAEVFMQTVLMGGPAAVNRARAAHETALAVGGSIPEQEAPVPTTEETVPYTPETQFVPSPDGQSMTAINPEDLPQDTPVGATLSRGISPRMPQQSPDTQNQAEQEPEYIARFRKKGWGVQRVDIQGEQGWDIDIKGKHVLIRRVSDPYGEQSPRNFVQSVAVEQTESFPEIAQAAQAALASNDAATIEAVRQQAVAAGIRGTGGMITFQDGGETNVLGIMELMDPNRETSTNFHETAHFVRRFFLNNRENKTVERDARFQDQDGTFNEELFANAAAMVASRQKAIQKGLEKATGVERVLYDYTQRVGDFLGAVTGKSFDQLVREMNSGKLMERGVVTTPEQQKAQGALAPEKAPEVRPLTGLESQVQQAPVQPEQPAASQVEPPASVQTEQPTPTPAPVSQEPAQEPLSFIDVVAAAQKWKGATMQAAREVEGNKRKQLIISRATTKGDLDDYLMRTFGLSEDGAREVSNYLTDQNLPPDESVNIEDYQGEKWADVALAARKPAQQNVAPAQEPEPVTQEVTPKQPWEMTREDFFNSVPDSSVNWLLTEEDKQSMHRSVIADALREGNPVPPKVLAEYPDLQPTDSQLAESERQTDLSLTGEPQTDLQSKDQSTSVIQNSAIMELPVDSIYLSEDVPQFKEDADEEGVVEALQGKFSRTPMRPIVVWERLNGRLEVITGRHRLDLARRSGEKTIPAQIVKESEGFTKQKAMILDAEANIQDGQGSVYDHAQYIRASGLTREEAETRGLIRGDKAQQGFTIGKYASDDLYTIYVNERNGTVWTDKKVSTIARIGRENEELQQLGINYVLKNPRASADQIGTVMQAFQNMSSQGKQTDMFGDAVFDDYLAEAEKRSKIALDIQRDIRERIKILKAAKIDPTKAASLGIDIKVTDPASIKTMREGLEQDLYRWADWPQYPDLVRQVVGEEPSETVEQDTETPDDQTPRFFSTDTYSLTEERNLLLRQAQGDPRQAWFRLANMATRAATRGEPVNRNAIEAMRRALRMPPEYSRLLFGNLDRAEKQYQDLQQVPAEEQASLFSTLDPDLVAERDMLLQRAGGDQDRAWKMYERMVAAAANRNEPVDPRKADAMRRALLGDQEQTDLFGEAAPAKERREFKKPVDRPVQQSLEGLDEGTLFSTAQGREPIQGVTYTDTPEFKRWFGNSKVVDENGQPLRVYHFTFNDITTFGKDKSLSGGFWFSDNSKAFGEGFEYVGGTGMPVFLSIKNPLNLSEATSEYDIDTWDKILGEHGISGVTFDSALNREKEYSFGYLVQNQDNALNGDGNLFDAIQAAGYDGIIAPSETSYGETNYVAFYPTQIKSATGNSGTFDPQNPDIRYSTKDHDKELSSNLKRLAGTNWAGAATRSDKFRKELDEAINGKREGFETLLEPLQEAIRRDGAEGLWTYVAQKGIIGHAEKPVYGVNSSLTNCNPSKNCAKYCYACSGNFTASNPMQKAELTDALVSLDPVRAGKRIAKEYKATAAYEAEKALRLFVLGDMSPDWVNAIKAINDEGVRTHIFSRRPELLSKVSDENIRLLSVDASNLDVADGNELPVAFGYTGTPEELEWIRKNEGIIQVVLPVRKSGIKMTDEMLSSLPQKAKQHLCPIDSGKKTLGEWNCQKCDAGKGIGCYNGQTTKQRGRMKGEDVLDLLNRVKENVNRQAITGPTRKAVLKQLAEIRRGLSGPAAGKETGKPGKGAGTGRRSEEGRKYSTAESHPSPIGLPELDRMVVAMLGSHPEIKRKLGNKRGLFQAEMMVGTIKLKADIFIGPDVHHAYSPKKPTEEQIAQHKERMAEEHGVSVDDLVIRTSRQGNGYVTSTYIRDHSYAGRTLAHEIGHADDWLPEKDLERGNLLGRIAKLSHYLKTTLAPSGNPEDALTARDRAIIRKRAKDLTSKDFNYKEDPEGFNARLSYLYHQFVQEEIEQRGLYHVKDTGQEGPPEWGGGMVTPGIRTELVNLSRWWRGPFDPEGDSAYDKMRRSSKELYADAISVLLNAPDVLADRAPQFHDALGNFFDKHQPMADLYKQIQEELSLGLTPEKRLERDRAMMGRDSAVRDKAILARQADEHPTTPREVWKSLVYNLADTTTHLPTQEARQAVKDVAYVGAKLTQFQRDIKAQVADVLNDAGVSYEDFGVYLMRRRAAGERQDMANPGLVRGEDAKALLATLRQDIGEEKYAAIEKAAKALTALRKRHIIPQIKRSGLFSEELMTKIENNEEYATFDVVDYFEKTQGHDAGALIRRQIGTAKDILNPFYATVHKDTALLFAAHVNTAKQTMVDQMRQFDQHGIREPEYKWNGRTREPQEPADRKNWGLVTYMADGVQKGVIVRREIADLFKHEPENANIIFDAANAATSVLKSIFTANNPLFSLWNIQRDFRSTLANIPAKGITGEIALAPQLALSYLKTAKDAFLHAFRKESTPLMRELLEGGLLIADRQWTAKDLTQVEEYERLIREFDLNPDSVGPFWKRASRAVFHDFNQAIEVWTKAAGYEYMKRKGLTSAYDMRDIMRGIVGSPDFLARGKMTKWTNMIFLYSNANIQGLEASWRAAKAQPMKYLLRRVAYTIIPSAIMAYLAFGDDDDDEIKDYRDAMRAIPEYEKRRMITLPVSWDGQKVTWIPLPQDHIGEMIHGIMWNLFSSNDSGSKRTLNILLGNIPMEPGSMNPWLQLGRAALQYAIGQNPYDFFKGRPAIDETIWQAGGFRSAVEFAKWSWNQTGGSTFGTFERPFQVRESGAAGLPVIKPALRRFLRTAEKQDAAEPVDTERARTVVSAKDFASEHIRAAGTERDANPMSAFREWKKVYEVPRSYKYSDFKRVYNNLKAKRWSN